MFSLFRRQSPLALFALGALGAAAGQGTPPVMRVLRAEPPGAELLRNGGFEQVAGGNLTGWTISPEGFSLVPEGRNASQAIRFETAAANGSLGAAQTLSLNATNIYPLVVSGWSKAENVSGSADSGYSLYVDIIYADDTPWWGQTANFRTGTHDWERRELMLFPEKPVKTLTVNCLLRGHSGKAWFDDVSVQEIKAQPGSAIFQGVPMTVSATPPRPSGKAIVLKTSDGLALTLHDNTVTSLRAGSQELACDAPSGFLARDVAAASDVFGFAHGQCAELGLTLKTKFKAEANRIVIEGRLTDTTGRDRAVTLLFALPVNAAGWLWGDDIRRSRRIERNTEYANTTAVRCGATGTLSLYPLAAICREPEPCGLALAIDLAQPAVYRLACNPATRQFFIAYDFGLVPETRRFPSSADFRFVLYRFDPRWGFRAAFQKLTELFPDSFRVRSRDQGLWMPFTDISTVQAWQDFGFKYHEGNNNVLWDDAHGILSFRYTEPMTWWMKLPKEAPRTLAEAALVRDSFAAGSKGADRSMAQVSQVAAMWDPSGQPALQFRNEPWCNGAVWSLNPNPFLSNPNPGRNLSRNPADRDPSFNAATVYWNDSIKQNLYGPSAKGQLDGEYLDSLEGYATAELNFRREHFRDSTVPLCFDSDTKQPALFKGLAVFEFARWLSDDVHRLGKLMFANGVPYRFSFLCPAFDVLGTETDWLAQGKYRPVPDARMNLWRTMSGQKPYLLLMNTDFDAFTPALVERYFQRSLFYGMYPGMFSHNAAENPYWQNPAWYNRGRPLFKKYIPLIKSVAQAGWQPLTGATSDNARVWLERFGPAPGDMLYLTLLNDTETPQTTTLHLGSRLLPTSGAIAARELVSGTAMSGSPSSWEVTLQPQEAKVIALGGLQPRMDTNKHQ